MVESGTTFVAEKISGKGPKEVAEFLNCKEDFPEDTVKELTEQFEKIDVEPENKEPGNAGNEEDDRQEEANDE